MRDIKRRDVAEIIGGLFAFTIWMVGLYALVVLAHAVRMP